jgi:hypothetical protein
MMRVPHLAQKLESRPGTGLGTGTRSDGPSCACCAGACRPWLESLCLRLEVDARYAIANTAEAIIAFVRLGALVNLVFISRT